MSPEVRRRRRRSPSRRAISKVRTWFAEADRRTRRRLLVGALAALVVLTAGWTVWSAAHDLSSAQNDATILRAQLVRGDAAGARRSLADLQDDAHAARDRTRSGVWRLLSAIPAVGDDLRATRDGAAVLADIADRGLPPLVDAASVVSADTFRPRDGRLPLEAAASLAAPVERSRREFVSAARRLDELDLGGTIGPLRGRLEAFRTQVGEAVATLDATSRAARLLPSMLGGEGPRTYLLVLQNNAEQRSGGGLPGALTLVRTDEGRLRIDGQGDTADLGRGDVGIRLNRAERTLFGDILADVSVDANLTPDVPRAAQILRARWESLGRPRLDGMVFVDPVAVSYLLEGTGPVAVPGYAPVSADTLVASVENTIYRTTQDRAAQSAYQQAVASAVFSAFTGGQGDTATVLSGLVRGVAEGRVRLHSFIDRDQRLLAGTSVAGELGRADRSPRLGVYVNDAGPSKLSYYLDYQGQVLARSCTAGRQRIAATVDFTADTPADIAALPPSITGAGLPDQRAPVPGDQVVVLYVAAPSGGDFTRVQLDGQRVTPQVVQLEGRPFLRVGFSFEPRQRHRLRFEVLSGQGQTGPVRLEVTPPASEGDAGDVSVSAC